MTYKITGMGDVEKRMAELTSAIREAQVVALKAAAQPLLNGWKENVLERAHKTGNYLRSIAVGEVQVTAKGAELEIGTDIVDPPYPFFLEYGTVKMTARPTMTPAFDENKDKAIAEATAVFKLVTKRLVR